MKSLVIFGVLAIVALVSSEDSCAKRVMGRCVECPPGTYLYSPGCANKIPEATCANPNPEPEEGILCDFSACYCSFPTVRDEATNQCVLLEDCSCQAVDSINVSI